MSASLIHRASVGASAKSVESPRAAPRRLPPPPLSRNSASAAALVRSPRAASRPPRFQTLSRAIVAAREDDEIAAFDGKPRYGRVLLKLSGEALAGDAGTGVDPAVLASVAADIAAAVRAGVEVAVVVGGGNYYRGEAAASSSGSSVDRATGDYVGMLATVMNALLLQGALERAGAATRVQTAIEMRQIAEPYIRRRAMRHLERGRVVIFGAGTGNPFFTTDSAAALRAAEVGADALLKATKVDGVFDRDPSGADGAGAVLLRSLSYADVSSKKLAVMDGTAFTLAAENGIDCVVFNMRRPGHVERALLGDPGIGTSIRCSSSADEDQPPPPPSSSSSSSFPRSAAARELLRVPTVSKGGVAWRGGVGVERDSDEGPSVGC